MKLNVEAPGALTGLKVLDLSGLAGQYCGKLFADLGAEVTLIEPPGGSPVRGMGPHVDDVVHVESSLTFAYFNAGKRSLVLDLLVPQDRDHFLTLVREADVVIESSKPGTMNGVGLGYEQLHEVNPRLVMVSITPFGQTGPFSQYECEDIVALALGGLLYLGGYPGVAPTAPWGNQAYLAASQFASFAAMMAVLHSEQTGKGSFVDVSIQESVVLALENAVQFFDLEGTVRKRHAGQQRQAGMGVFPCADGQIYFMAGGVASNKFWAGSVRWLIEEKVAGAEQLNEPRWLDMAFLSSDEAKRIFASIFEPFSLRKTKEQLYAEGQARRLPICPINTPADLLKNRQLAWRGHFVEMPHTWSGRSFAVPGSPYHLSASPWRQAGPSPMLGEHTAMILGSRRSAKLEGATL